jgi:LysM repeat protein
MSGFRLCAQNRALCVWLCCSIFLFAEDLIMYLTSSGASQVDLLRRFRRLPAWLLKSVVVTGLVMGGCFVSGWSALLSAQEVSTHVVQPGETLSSIARRYGVSVDTLARQNGIVNLNLVRVGQVLRIHTAVRTTAQSDVSTRSRLRQDLPYDPPAQPSNATERIYTVRRGDTLYSIAARFGVTEATIRVRNRLTTNFIFVGQRLIIP